MTSISRMVREFGPETKPGREAILIELNRIRMELQQRLALCVELRERGFGDSEYAELLSQFREEIPTPVMDELFKAERPPLPEDVLLDCIVSHLRLRRLCATQPQRELLLQHEVLLTLAYTAAQRAFKRVLNAR